MPLFLPIPCDPLPTPCDPPPPPSPRHLPPGLVLPHAGVGSAPQPAAPVQGAAHLDPLGTSGWRAAPPRSAPRPRGHPCSSQQVLRLCTRQAPLLCPPTHHGSHAVMVVLVICPRGDRAAVTALSPRRPLRPPDRQLSLTRCNALPLPGPLDQGQGLPKSPLTPCGPGPDRASVTGGALPPSTTGSRGASRACHE